ncbi:MAG: ATP-binding protein [Pseudomonadota bacterium]
MAFGGQQQLQLETISIRALIEGLEDLTQGIIREDIRVAIQHLPTEHYVSADYTLLEQVLLNLVINGMDAMPDGGVLNIEVLKSGDRIGVSVTDSGGGMSTEVAKRIFDPFFTTKADVGTGLGLSISLGIIKQHQGTLSCTQTSINGSCFEVWLPEVFEAPWRETEPQSEVTQGRSTWPNSILFVEDEEAVRDVVTKMLHTLGFRPLVARTPAQALEILEQQKVDLLISDVVMPEMRGPALYQEALKTQPNLAALFISGYTQETAINMPTGNERVNFLAKPFSMGKLKQAIDQTNSDLIQSSEEKTS